MIPRLLFSTTVLGVALGGCAHAPPAKPPRLHGWVRLDGGDEVPLVMAPESAMCSEMTWAVLVGSFVSEDGQRFDVYRSSPEVDGMLDWWEGIRPGGR